jgi:hypothetical protein
VQIFANFNPQKYQLHYFQDIFFGKMHSSQKKSRDFPLTLLLNDEGRWNQVGKWAQKNSRAQELDACPKVKVQGIRKLFSVVKILIYFWSVNVSIISSNYGQKN